jgi:hypothetical protein
MFNATHSAIATSTALCCRVAAANLESERGISMKLFLTIAFMIGMVLVSGLAEAAIQDKYDLPEPYAGYEKSYLREFPDLQALMDVMVKTYAGQLKAPEQDILHVRVCSALSYRMAMDLKLSRKDRRLAIVTDLLHDISKQDKKAVLTDPAVFSQSADMVKALRRAGYLKSSKLFWTDEKLLQSPAVGGNIALIHHITGALQAGQILKQSAFAREDIDIVQAAILGHSTGYWYFRDMVDKAGGKSGAWQIVFPEPVGSIAKFAHDADLISQFVPESVVPDGSKWRGIAKHRWGAKNSVEEAHVVYYVFLRLFEEAKTPAGKELARGKWDAIRTELIKLMGLSPEEDPIKKLGVPAAFRK